MVLVPAAILFSATTSKDRVVRTADAFVTSLIIAEGLKSVVREERPNHDDMRSFPSEHTTAAFAIATVQAHYDPRNAGLWYAGATAVGVWRVSEKQHFVQDVVAGGLIGYFTAQAVVHSPHGLLITPLFSRDEIGIAMSAKF